MTAASARADSPAAAAYAAVAAGGALGAVMRWLAGPWVQSWAGAAFPWGTLAINATGSLLLGFLAQWLPSRAPHPQLRAFLTVGICGGYTTFSTYAAETVALAAAGRQGAALAYAAGSVAVCVAATFAGFRLGDALGHHPSPRADTPPTG